MKDHQTEVMQDAVKLTKAFQAPDKDKKDKKKSGIAERRKTVANLNSYHKKAQREGENLNLEKQFKIKFAQMGIQIRTISGVNYYNDDFVQISPTRRTRRCDDCRCP